MPRLGKVVWSPVGHLIRQCLLTTILLVAWSDANRLSASVSGVPHTATPADFPYNFWQEDGRVTSSPSTTSEPSIYEYYLSQEEGDLGSDPSTWKLLPIQIPDDLVSNAILKEEEEEVTLSTVPSYPTFPTPQYGQHPGATEPQPLYHPERFHASFSKGHRSPEPQQQTWDRHGTESGHGSPEPQQQTWGHHGTESGHRSPEPQQQTWDHHGTESGHRSPEPQQQTWDRHGTESGHRSPEPQQQTWGHYSTESGHGNPEPQQQTWGHHGTRSGHRSPEPQHHTWDRHGPGSGHVSPELQHHTWDRHNLDGSAHHGQRPAEPHYHNWTHTSDGYEIRNHYVEEHLDPHRSATYPNTYHLQHQMPSRPSAGSWKPPNAPSWQQNLVERLSQHLPRLPTLPKLRLPRLGNLPPFSRRPPRLSAERVHQVQGQAPDHPQVEGDYVHEFYPLIPKNDPLEHLNSNLDRYHKPHYTYPPRQDHTNQDDTLDLHQNTDNFPEDQSQHPSVDGDDGYLAQHLTETTLHYDAQDAGHHSPEDETQMSQQEPHNGHHLPRYPHHTRPDPRRPFHSHARPERILKVQQHQAHKEQSGHHHIPRGTWEEQQEPPSTAHHPLRDPYNRRTSSAQNWIFQEAGDPGGGSVPSSSTHEDHHHHHHHHTPHKYSAHAQQPYDHGSSHGDSQHQQQQGLDTSWYSESQHQQGLNAEFNPEVHNSILGPLSNLVSRPSPLSFIGTSPYQQSVIERLTGVEASSTTSLVIPGGLLVLGLALALFYFNFVWYPTPVVTAKIFKMLSESASDGALSEGQQRAVGEVYRVFRGLEAEYRLDPSISSTSCRSRLVCQVHQELPGLWKVTQAYVAFVKSSLVSGPAGDSDFSGYQEAARRGSEGQDCLAHYHKCALQPVPVKATLRKLLALLPAA